MTDTRRQIEAEENAVIDFQFLLLDLLHEARVTKEELAERLGVSKARVSQLFAPGANPTMRTAARLLEALNFKLDVRAEIFESTTLPKPAGKIRVKAYFDGRKQRRSKIPDRATE